MNKPEYTYQHAFGKWRVDKMNYHYTKDGNLLASYGSKVAEYDTRKEARAEVYRLNGWKLPTNKI